MTFWDHLEELRFVLIRALLAVTLCSVAAFLLGDDLFKILLAPTHSEFLTYRLIDAPADFRINLVNTGLTEQFFVHLRTAFYVGILFSSPYIIYVVAKFVAPGLYQREKVLALQLVCASYVMFLIGTLVNFFFVFPLTVRFLGTYQVSPEVSNMLTLQSYTDTLLGLGLVMGLVFELPVVCFFLSRTGLLTIDVMRRYRRHTFVAILVVAAVITPTGDPFSLFIVSLPIYLLYELSILVISKTG